MLYLGAFLLVLAGVFLAVDYEGYWREWVLFVVVVAFGIACLLYAEISEKMDSYKQGQIDAITGKVNYQLQTNPDKTVEWVKIKE